MNWPGWTFRKWALSAIRNLYLSRIRCPSGSRPAERQKWQLPCELLRRRRDERLWQGPAAGSRRSLHSRELWVIASGAGRGDGVLSRRTAALSGGEPGSGVVNLLPERPASARVRGGTYLSRTRQRAHQQYLSGIRSPGKSGTASARQLCGALYARSAE